MEKKYEPITYSEAVWWADYAKEMGRKDAENAQRYLLCRASKVGVASPDVLNIINGMLATYIEEDRNYVRQQLTEQLRREGMVGQEKIEADDDQIAQAIKWTLPKFKSFWEWSGIHRILVANCDFPEHTAAFVRRMAKMGVYQEKKCPVKVERLIPPAIKKDEYGKFPFSYQSIQKGKDKDCSRIMKIFKINLYKAVNL